MSIFFIMLWLCQCIELMVMLICYIQCHCHGNVTKVRKIDNFIPNISLNRKSVFVPPVPLHASLGPAIFS